MALVKLLAPHGSRQISYNGDSYDVIDGIATVPHGAEKVLCQSHGFKPVVIEGDDEVFTVGNPEEVAAEPEFDPAQMSKAQLLSYFETVGVAIPAMRMTVGQLRKAALDHYHGSKQVAAGTVPVADTV